MKIALIGASGFVGSAVLKEALDRGHEITAIVRNPERVGESNDRLQVLGIDVTDKKALTEAVKGHDIVVSAFNPGWTNPNIYSEFLEGAKSIQAAVKNSGVDRFFIVGGAGSLFIAPETQLVDTPDFPQEIKDGALAAREYLEVLKEEEALKWTFLSPAIEMHPGTAGERRGAYRKGLENPVFDENNRSVISVEDIAMAIIDEVEEPKHIRERFTVAY